MQERFTLPDGSPIGPVTTNYSYDPSYQLTSAIYPDYQSAGMSTPPSWNNQTHSWSYDGIGNRLTFTKYQNGSPIDTSTYSYNKLRLTGITHTDSTPSEAFSYDDNGNLLTEAIAGSSTLTYNWNMEDKLIEVKTNGAATSNYIYSYNGDRLQRTLNGITWNYLYSNEDILKIHPNSGSDVYLTQGSGIDDVLAETISGVTNYAYKNHLSSVMQLTNSLNSSTQQLYLYDAWGQVTNWPLPTLDNNPYGYTGREWDIQNLHYYRARYYMPPIGKFISVDPYSIYLTLSKYIYTNNAPIQYADNYGFFKVDPNGSCKGKGIENAASSVERALNNNCTGIAGMSSDAARKFANSTIYCKPQPATREGAEACGASDADTNEIDLYPLGLSPTSPCGCVESTILHEIMHITLYPPGTPEENADNCAKKCFECSGRGNPCECKRAYGN